MNEKERMEQLENQLSGYWRVMASPIRDLDREKIRDQMSLLLDDHRISPGLVWFLINCYNAALNSGALEQPESWEGQDQ